MNAPKKCVILDQHSSRGEEFLERYPEIMDSIAVKAECFDEFVNLERDAGAKELAMQIGKIVAEESDGDIGVTIVKSHLPRAVLDTNRVTSKAVRNVIDYSNLQEFENDFKEIHVGVISEIRRELSCLLYGSGVFVDVHTMAPYTPGVIPQSKTEVLSEKPDNLAHYVRAYVNARRTGRRRFMDLMTALPGMPPLADAVLTAKIKKKLDKSHLKYRENDPYPTGPYIMSTEYMSHFPGITIETPKDYLTETASEKGFDLINPQICPDKVDRIARPIAEAVKRCLIIR